MSAKIFPIHAYSSTSPAVFGKDEAIRLLDVMIPWMTDNSADDAILDWQDVFSVSASGAAILMGNLIKARGVTVLEHVRIQHASEAAMATLENSLDAVCPA